MQVALATDQMDGAADELQPDSISHESIYRDTLMADTFSGRTYGSLDRFRRTPPRA